MTPKTQTPPAPHAPMVPNDPIAPGGEAILDKLSTVGRNVPKKDAEKLVLGKPAFTDDVQMRGTLIAKILTSPHAHADITHIDAAKARALAGVHAVLTYKDVPRIPYTTAGQGHPEPSPYDNFMLDHKVRFVGDRVAVVAAETREIAEQALALIDVEYQVLPALLDPRHAMDAAAPKIHDEPETTGIHDKSKNIAAYIHAELGSVEEGLKAADVTLEQEYEVPYVQQTPIEPHVTIAWLDEDNRLVIRTSTQVPYHVRRICARVLEIPVARIRVVKPRIGGGFGAKQEVLIEDLCGALALATKRPVKLELTRAEEFISSRTRHPQILKIRSGWKKDGTLIALEGLVLANTGAYGAHALTVQCNTGSKPFSLYRCPNVRFEATVVYTNLPVAGAFRGYGVPQGAFALESHVDEAADTLGMDPLDLRRKNMIKVGDTLPLARVLGEGKEGYEQLIRTCGLEECITRGAEAIGWKEKRANHGDGPIKRGVGMALCIHGSAIPGVDMAAAHMKLNDDGSFNLQVGATDLGTGSDTVITQIAAEVLSVAMDKIIIYSSDTDFTPFDKGAYASSTTYISGMAAKKAAEQCRQQILEVGARLLGEPIDGLTVKDGYVIAPGGRKVSYADVALDSLYAHEQKQIMGSASHMSEECPPPFEAQFAEVEVDTETGRIRVLHFVTAMDCGVPVNPNLVQGQIHGGATQGLGYGLTEHFVFDDKGRMQNPTFRDYKIFSSKDMPKFTDIIVVTDEPHGPFGVKAAAEIPIDGPAPAVANALFNATGLRMRSIPLTSERVWQAANGATP